MGDLPELSEYGFAVVAFLLVAFVLLSLSFCFHRFAVADNSDTNVPAVGVPPGIYAKIKARYRWKAESEILVSQGMAKYGQFGKPFRIITPARDMVFVTNPVVLSELMNLPDDYMCARAAIDEYTLHERIFVNAYNVCFWRRNMSRKFADCVPDVLDEVAATFAGIIRSESEWVTVHALSMSHKVVWRSANRVLIGSPLCRNEGLMNEMLEYPTRMFAAIKTFEFFPLAMRRLVSRFVFNKEKHLSAIVRHIGPVFEFRRMKALEHALGWVHKPDDAIQWILEAMPSDTPLQELVESYVLIGAVGVYITSLTFVHALLDVARDNELQEILKQEVEKVVSDCGGLTKTALDNMVKLDSTLRESARLSPVSIATMLHKSMRAHTFCDGTQVDKGMWVAAPAAGIHIEPSLYAHPENFSPFRFLDTPNDMTRTSLDYLAFGHGENQCPGRFFAVAQLKVMLAYVVCNYHLRLLPEGTGHRPPNVWVAANCLPNPLAILMAKARASRARSPLFVAGSTVAGIPIGLAY